MLTVVLVAMAMAAPAADTSSTPAIYRPMPGCDTTVLVNRIEPIDPIKPPACINAAAERRRDRLQCGGGPDTTCFAATTSRRGAP